MATLAQMTLGNMLSLLTQNPNVAVFGQTTSDYPGGITRPALLAAFLLAVQNNALYDSVTGFFGNQVYAPGILKNAGVQVTGGKQDKEIYQPNAFGPLAPSLPTSAGENIVGGTLLNPPSGSDGLITANTSTGTKGAVIGEFSPPGDCGAVATLPIVSAVSPGVAFGGSPAITTLATQVI